MLLSLIRFNTTKNSTYGILYIDGIFSCFTLEDTRQIHKIKGETRIRDGLYTIKLRTDGSLHERYLSRFGNLHKGMLWLQNVPEFEYIYLHIGNTPDDSEGCVLVGNFINGNGLLADSTSAYKKMYAKVIEAFDRNESVYIKISNLG